MNEFEPKGKADDHKADDEDGEYRRAIAGILELEVEAADGAAFGDSEHAIEQLSATALGTTAKQAGAKHGRQRRELPKKTTPSPWMGEGAGSACLSEAFRPTSRCR